MSEDRDLPQDEPEELEEPLLRERDESLCPCKSRLPYSQCCRDFHHGKKKCETAEQLMRSRYSAYFFRLPGYLFDTQHPDSRPAGLKKSLEKTLWSYNWANLKVLGTVRGEKGDNRGKVEFEATCFIQGEEHHLHEVSRFKRHKSVWKYLDDKG